MVHSTFRSISSCLLIVFCCSCSSAYYGAIEKIGIHKRDLLVSRIEAARDSQKDAQKEFKSALEKFKDVTNFDGGNLEKTYSKLQQQLLSSEAKAKTVHERIESVDRVALALFKEWKAELKQYESSSLRASNEKELIETKSRYAQLINAMRKAEKRIDPVLKPLRDQVLFLKHNLNAKAIGSLDRELSSVEGNIDTLLIELQRSIDEANSFIAALGS